MIKKIIYVLLIFILNQQTYGNIEIKELSTSTGIKFWYGRDESSNLVQIDIAFKNSGSSNMPLKYRTLPSIFSSMLLSGCGKYSKKEWEEAWDNIASVLSVRSSKHHLLVSITCPKIVLQDAIDLFRTMIFSPHFKQQELDKIKNSLVAEFDNYTAAPEYFASAVFMPQLIFGEHPYALFLGHTEDLIKINISDLKSYQDNYLVQKNLEVCMVGNLTDKKAIAIIEKLFSGLKKGQIAEDKVPDAKITFTNKIDFHHMEGPQSIITFALPSLSIKSDNYFASKILYHILGGNSFKSRIISKLREKLGLIYYGSVHQIFNEHANWGLGIICTSNENVESAIQAIKEIIKELKTKGITENELKFAKENIKGKFLTSYRTAYQMCAFYFNQKLLGQKSDALEKLLQGLDNTKLEQVNQVAKDLLNEDNIPFVIIGEKK